MALSRIYTAKLATANKVSGKFPKDGLFEKETPKVTDSGPRKTLGKGADHTLRKICDDTDFPKLRNDWRKKRPDFPSSSGPDSELVT